MGQKVHPIGFRVGITKKHQSNWFAPFHKRSYAQAVQEDRLLRETLLKLFPSLFQTKSERGGKSTDRDSSGPSNVPTITQIQIERGFMPYEIGIRIHADNCARLRASLDRLNVPAELVSQLQLARQSLLDFRTQCPALGTTTADKMTATPAVKGTSKKDGNLRARAGTRGSKGMQKGRGSRSLRGRASFKASLGTAKRRRWLNDMEFKRVRSMRRRLRKRVALRYWQSRLNRARRSLLVLRKGATFRLRTRMQSWALSQKRRVGAPKLSNARSLNQSRRSLKGRGRRNRRPWMLLLRKPLPKMEPVVGKAGNLLRTVNVRPEAAGSQRQKAVVSALMKKLNTSFLLYVRQQVQMAKKMVENGTASLAYRRAWRVSNVAKLKKYGWQKLNRMLRALRRRGSQQLQILRQRYVTDGRLSMALVMPLLQSMRWAKVLRAVIQTLPQQAVTKKRAVSMSRRRKLAPACPPDGSKSWAVFHLRKQVRNIPEEHRKAKLIGYLSGLVQQHRRENVYYYLSSLAQAKRDLHQVQMLTKKYASALFGLNSAAEFSDAQRVTERVTQTLQNSLKLPEWEQGWKDTLIHHLHNQRVVAEQNLQLIPRISIKFYRVKSSKVVAKASVIAASIVDQIEQRKAFRKVIKTAKETAMQQPNVRGVKIQVSGRLNGAEIARTEWVRSGRVPLQTLRANIDYTYQTAQTIYGVIGVKVWVFKGYTKVRGSVFLSLGPRDFFFKRMTITQKFVAVPRGDSNTEFAIYRPLAYIKFIASLFLTIYKLITPVHFFKAWLKGW